jgi:hypothetical protein
VLLGQHAVSDQGHGRSRRQLALQLDGERVHGDRADHPPSILSHQHLGAHEVAAKAVRVPDRDDPDPGRSVGDEPSPVASALPGVEPLDQREPAAPRQHRPQPVVGRVGAERREPVERDAAAGRIEPGLGETQHCGRVRGVRLEAGMRVHQCPEAPELEPGKVRIGVRGREMAHQADHVLRRVG